MVDKSRITFVIDALMFLCLTAMAGLGLLMRYVLVPGRAARATYGRPVELTWLGWDRHDWGDLHFFLALVMVGLLTVHLILHWQMILGLFARLIPDARRRRRVAFAFLLLVLLLLYFPFLATPKVEERGRGWFRSGARSHQEAPPGLVPLNPAADVKLAEGNR
jgi:cell division protein FtsW (lipid II flippase)